jgi:type IV secretion system protein VirD4
MLLVLATGHLSALVFSGGWPTYRAAEVPGVLWRFGGDPLDPAAAWAPVNRGAPVPGAAAWWITCAALVAAVAVPAGLAVTRSSARQRSGSSWARGSDLRRLRLHRRDPARLVVGTQSFRAVAVEARHSLLVFGPTQSGKTTGLAVPAILEWAGPVVATSTKGDLVDDTIGWRQHLGEVHIFDPAGATTYPRSCWSPLAGCWIWDGASATARELAMAGKAAVGSSMALADFWFSSASKALAPYLFAAARSNRRIDDVARWIDREERDEVLAIVADEDPDAALAHEATFRREDRARSSLFQVMQEILGAYLDPGVATSASRNDIVATDLLDGTPRTLYLSAPHHHQARLRPLFSTLVGQVLTAIYDHVAATGAPLDPPLLLVLDEAANIAPVEDLPTVASTAAAMGLQVVTVFQDLAQVRGRYGQAAGTVVNNHRAKLALPGVSDVDTLDLFSRLAGEYELARDSVTSDMRGHRSRTSSTYWRRLLPLELARQLRDGRGVLLYGNLPPIRLRLRPWYKNRSLKRRASFPTPAGSRLPCPKPDRVPATDAEPGARPVLPKRPTSQDRTAPGNLTAVEAARNRLRLVPPPPDGGEQ